MSGVQYAAAAAPVAKKYFSLKARGIFCPSIRSAAVNFMHQTLRGTSLAYEE
jgi:hypothetical protein